MAEKCELPPEACQLAGTGPECFKQGRDGRASGYSKEDCLKDVKKRREELFKDCIQQCREDYVNYMKEEVDPQEHHIKEEYVAIAPIFNCWAVRYWYRLPSEPEYPVLTLYFSDEANPPNPEVYPGTWLWCNAYAQTLSEGCGAIGTEHLTIDQVRNFNEQFGTFANCKIPEEKKVPQEVIILDCWGGDTPATTTSTWFECQAECINAIEDWDTTECYCHQIECKIGNPFAAYAWGNESNRKEKKPTPEDPLYKTRLEQINTESAYGIPIERIYSRQYVPGNLIWVSDVETVTTSELKLILDTDTNTYFTATTGVINNYITMAFGLGAQVEAVSRIWMNDALLYDSTNPALGGSLSITLLTGSESQQVCDFFTTIDGMGRTPAYRGLSVIVLKDLNLTTFEGDFPQFKFEVWRTADTNSTTTESAAMTDLTEDLYHYDVLNQRLFVTDNTDRVRIIDTSDFSVVRNVAITSGDPDTYTVTNLSHIVAQTGAVASTRATGTFDPVFGESLVSATIPNMAAGATRVVERLTSAGVRKQTLCLSTSTGDVHFYEFDDFAGGVGDLLESFTALFSGAVDFFGTQTFLEAHSTYANTDVYTTAVFAFRAEANTIKVEVFPTNTEDTFKTLLQDGGHASYTIPSTTFGATVTILSIYEDDTDNTFVIFVALPSGFKIVKWKPSGVVWVKDVSTLPDFGKTELCKRGSRTPHLLYVSTDNQIYKLTLETGEVEVVATVATPIHATYQMQSYDAVYRELIYFTNTNKFAKAQYAYISGTNQALSEIVEDICELCELDAALVDTSSLTGVVVQGYRTGDSLEAWEIIEDLSAIYPFGRYDETRLVFNYRGNTTEIEVDSDHLKLPFGYTRLDSTDSLQAVSIEYNDSASYGAPTKQFFNLPDADSTQDGEEIAFNVVESGTYIRRLAELWLLRTLENDTQATITLPARYIGMLQMDTLDLGVKYRIQSFAIGGDLTCEVTLVLDDVSKYNDTVALTGISGFDLVTVTRTRVPQPEPLIFNHRPINPTVPNKEAVVRVAPDNLTDSVPGEGSISIARIIDEFVNTRVSQAVSITDTVAWGRLVTAPADPGTAKFTTQTAGSFQVKFFSSEMASRLSSATYEQLLEDPLRNLMVLGSEAIQFQDVSVGMDGVTVTCSKLFRYRWCTDDANEHVVGEACYYYETDTTGELRCDVDEYAIKVATMGIQTRRRDTEVGQFASRPAPVNILRFDHEPDADSTPASHPDNKHVTLRWDMRAPWYNSFTDTLVAAAAPYSAVHSLCEVYLLRDNYDEDLFNQYRYDEADTSYIMWRTESELFVNAYHDSYQLGEYELPDVIEEGDSASSGCFVWYARQQAEVDWDYTVDKLCVVVISTDPAYTTESKPCVRCFTPGTNYMIELVQGMETVST